MAKSKQAASSAKPARSARRAAAGQKAAPLKPARKLARSAKREPQKSTGETKQARVIALLERDTGATLAELIAVTGWLPHTTRAPLTGLRHKGLVLDKSKREDGTTVYRITSTPASDARQAG
jgi:DNA-binding MarR family transcriptional regulator